MHASLPVCPRIYRPLADFATTSPESPLPRWGRGEGEGTRPYRGRLRRSGLDLAANFPAGIGSAMHVDVEVSEPVSLVLGVIESDGRRDGPHIVACLVQGHDHRPVLTRRSQMNVGRATGDAGSGHAATHRPVHENG